MSSGGKNVGYTGAGEWSAKIDSYSGEEARPYKAFDLEDFEDVRLKTHSAENHFTPEGSLDDNPSEYILDEFYEGQDINVIANVISAHGDYAFDAIERMPKGGLVVAEKALSGQPSDIDAKELGELAKRHGKKAMISEHYHKKPAIEAAERSILENGLDDIKEVRVYGQEKDFNQDRGWITLPPEGGIAVDWGIHGAAIGVVNLDGEFTGDVDAVGYETDFGVSGYPGAFEAVANIDGDRFADQAQLYMLMGKGFNEDRKGFEIIGEDEDHGMWLLEGSFGTETELPYFRENWRGHDNRESLVEEPSAKEKVVDEYIQVHEGEKNPKLSLSDYDEIIRLPYNINQEIGLEDEVPEIEPWEQESVLEQNSSFTPIPADD